MTLDSILWIVVIFSTAMIVLIMLVATVVALRQPKLEMVAIEEATVMNPVVVEEERTFVPPPPALPAPLVPKRFTVSAKPTSRCFHRLPETLREGVGIFALTPDDARVKVAAKFGIRGRHLVATREVRGSEGMFFGEKKKWKKRWK